MPFLARWMECATWVATSTGAWMVDEEEGEKNVGTGTKTPSGGGSEAMLEMYFIQKNRGDSKYLNKIGS